MKLRVSLVLFVVLLLGAACAPVPFGLPALSAPSAAAPTAAPPTAVTPIPATSAVEATPAPVPGTVAPPVAASDWQTYSNGDAGFRISYPGGWNQADLPPNEMVRGVSLDGPEGTVELYWGTGFGGACPGGYSTVKVADGELPACYTVGADGIQRWEQINKELPTTSFSGRAFTKDAAQASADAVLAVLATLAFEQPPAASVRPPPSRRLRPVRHWRPLRRRSATAWRRPCQRPCRAPTRSGRSSRSRRRLSPFP